MANYSIDDRHSTLISAGYRTRQDALRAASRAAAERGEPVYLYSDEPESEYEEISPPAID